MEQWALHRSLTSNILQVVVSFLRNTRDLGYLQAKTISVARLLHVMTCFQKAAMFKMKKMLVVSIGFCIGFVIMTVIIIGPNSSLKASSQREGCLSHYQGFFALIPNPCGTSLVLNTSPTGLAQLLLAFSFFPSHDLYFKFLSLRGHKSVFVYCLGSCSFLLGYLVSSLEKLKSANFFIKFESGR